MNLKILNLLILGVLIVLGSCESQSKIITWGTKGTGDGQFQYAEDFAIDSQGNVLVTDAINANVQVFTPEGKFMAKFGVKGQGEDNGELTKPEGIAIDRDGNIFLADYVTGYIQEIR